MSDWNKVKYQGFTRIDGETVAERYNRLKDDSRRHLSEEYEDHTEWLDESVESETDLIEEYLYSFVLPSQLPSLLERKILDGEYSTEELDEIAEELSDK